jgi:hypothetical protein
MDWCTFLGVRSGSDEARSVGCERVSVATDGVMCQEVSCNPCSPLLLVVVSLLCLV